MNHLFSTQHLPRKGKCLRRQACKSTVCILLGLLYRTDDPWETSLLHPQERGSRSDRRRVTHSLLDCHCQNEGRCHPGGCQTGWLRQREAVKSYFWSGVRACLKLVQELGKHCHCLCPGLQEFSRALRIVHSGQYALSPLCSLLVCPVI